MSPARTPGTLFAAMDAPTPLPQSATPRSTSPAATALARWIDEVGVVISGVQFVCAEVHDLVPRPSQRLRHLPFQRKPSMVRGDSDAHHGPSLSCRSRSWLCLQIFSTVKPKCCMTTGP